MNMITAAILGIVGAFLFHIGKAMWPLVKFRVRARWMVWRLKVDFEKAMSIDDKELRDAAFWRWTSRIREFTEEVSSDEE